LRLSAAVVVVRRGCGARSRARIVMIMRSMMRRISMMRMRRIVFYPHYYY
jgi:hypothetical protein